MLFVFESPGSEDAFLHAANRLNGVPLIASNVETLAERGILGNSWRLPPPHPPDRRPLSSVDTVA